MKRPEFNYHTARYHAPWLGRWTSCDPAGIVGGINPYVYGGDNPLRNIDPLGTDCQDIIGWGPNGSNTIIHQCTPETGKGGIVLTASLSGPTRLPSSTNAPAQAAPAAKPSPKAPPSKPAMSDADSLKILKRMAEQNLPKLTYPKELTHALGVVQMVGGGLELAGAALTAETGVGPMLLGANGLDTLQTGARTAWTGEQQRSAVFYAGSGASFLFSNDPELATAFGSTADMAAGVGAGAYSLKIIPPPVIALPAELADTSLVAQTLEQGNSLKTLASTDPAAEIRRGNQVLAGVEHRPTGLRTFGRSGEDVAPNLHLALEEYAPWRGLIEGDPNYARLGPPGAHGEINALNRALWTLDPTGTTLTATDLGSFDMTAVWLGKSGPFVMPRCPTCWFMTPYVNYLGPIGPR